MPANAEDRARTCLFAPAASLPVGSPRPNTRILLNRLLNYCRDIPPMAVPPTTWYHLLSARWDHKTFAPVRPLFLLWPQGISKGLRWESCHQLLGPRRQNIDSSIVLYFEAYYRK